MGWTLVMIIGLLWSLLMVAVPAPAPPSNGPLVETPALGEIIVFAIQKSGPIVVEDKPGWGDQVRVFDGWEGTGKGLGVKIRKRTKAVNHGLWQHYRLSLDDPIKDLRIEFPKLQYMPDRGVDYLMQIDARLQGYADVKQYSNGLKLFSAAAEGDVDVRLLVAGHVKV